MSKRIFEILDEMNQEDTQNKTNASKALVAVCTECLGANKTLRGATVKMGAPESVLFGLASNEQMCVLLVVNKAEYFKRYNEVKASA